MPAARAGFGLGVCAVALIAGSARGESYRLVEPTLRATEVRNGYLEWKRGERISRSGHYGLWFVGGTSELGFEELDAELARHGWSTVGLTETNLGLAGTAVVRSWYIGFVLDGSPNEIVGPNGESGNVGIVRVSGQLGWEVYGDEALSLAPFFGIGVTSLNVLGRTSDPNAHPLFSGQVRTGSAGFEVQRTGGHLEMGIGAQTFPGALGTLALPSAPALGFQLGYRAGFAEGDWHGGDGDVDLEISDPETLQEGFFVRLLIGWVWPSMGKQPVFQRVERCSGPRCRVRCENGFGDCDFDPRNGCEAPRAACPQAVKAGD